MLIAVLEDAPARIEWLRDLVGGRHDVRHFTTVRAFLADDATPDLVILDHDLDGIAGSGPDGLTGLDACDRMPPVARPVLVWSMNPSRAPVMVQTLRRRGVSATWRPFGTDACCAVIARTALACAREEAR